MSVQLQSNALQAAKTQNSKELPRVKKQDSRDDQDSKILKPSIEVTNKERGIQKENNKESDKHVTSNLLKSVAKNSEVEITPFGLRYAKKPDIHKALTVTATVTYTFNPGSDTDSSADVDN